MRFIVFVTPLFNDFAIRAIDALLDVSGQALAIVSQDVEENLPAPLRARLVKHFRVADVQSGAEITAAARFLAEHVAPIDRLVGLSEFVQLSVAEARAALSLPGPTMDVIRRFRDKPLMKEAMRDAGLPCARHRLATDEAAARSFVADVGFPVVVKPPLGVGSTSTFTARDHGELALALGKTPPTPDSPVLLEEFVTGDEFTFDAVVIGGRPVWHSITRYLPNPIDAVKNPWIQWRVILPREIDWPFFDPIRSLGFRALAALGLETGICHMEWFRRPDGSVCISEVAARPGGAQIMTLNARAHDFDMYGQISRLYCQDTFDPPGPTKYAAGAVFLRGQGEGGVVRAVHGKDEAMSAVGRLVTDLKWPVLGQPRATGYEGEGYVVVRHPETRVVEEATRKIIELVRVEVG